PPPARRRSVSRRAGARRPPRRCTAIAAFRASTTSTSEPDASRWLCSSQARVPVGTEPPTGSTRSCRRFRVAEPTAVLVAARDEGAVTAETVGARRRACPGAEVIAADDGSRAATADRAEAAGAIVLRLARRGKGQALSAAERAAPPGVLLLVDADLRGDPSPLLVGGETAFDLRIARFAERRGGGFGIAKGAARRLIRLP